MLLTRLLIALVPTILIEWGVLLMLGERQRRVLWASVLINALTNVPLNLYVIHYGISPMGIAVGETLVVAVEAMGYYWLIRDFRKALVYSFLCNAISFLIGCLVQLLFLLTRNMLIHF